MRSFSHIGYTVMGFLLAVVRVKAAIPGNGTVLSLVDQQIITYEEYIIEHEISSEQARNAGLAIDLSSLEPPPGCQKCSASEIHYCQGRDFINDHCCCDKRYHEVLPYIPHTCYLGTQLCMPVVGDCAKYNRLRLCCCNLHVFKKWKSGGSMMARPRNFLFLSMAVVITTILGS